MVDAGAGEQVVDAFGERFGQWHAVVAQAEVDGAVVWVRRSVVRAVMRDSCWPNRVSRSPARRSPGSRVWSCSSRWTLACQMVVSVAGPVLWPGVGTCRRALWPVWAVQVRKSRTCQEPGPVVR